MKAGNLLIVQSGIPSVVGNAALFGALSEALNYENIEEIYGVYNGFEGILTEKFVDLASLSQKKAQLFLSTEGHVLKSESDQFQGNYEDFEKMVAVLSQKNIRFVTVIGDQTAIIYTQTLSRAAKTLQYDLQVLVIPTSNDNEIPMTDHSLGYGSYIKFLNAHLSSFCQFLESHNIQAGICEIDSGNNGWVVAGSALSWSSSGKSANLEEVPYVVCLPEQPFNEEKFLEIVRNKIQRCGHILIVTHSQLVNEEGANLDVPSIGEYLENLIHAKLNVSTCLDVCDMRFQPLSHFISKQDQTEAISCGKEAVLQLLENGESDKAAVLIRKTNEVHAYEINFLPLQDFVNNLKFFPTDWISEETMSLHYAMIKYALPLIQGEVPVTYEKGLRQFAQL